MYFVIGADFIPSEKNLKLFSQGEMIPLMGEDLYQMILGAEYRIFNLEAPVTDRHTPIRKCGPHLAVPTSALKGYQALHVDVFTMANNHILDQGDQGLLSTCKYLKENGIQYVGAGQNIEQASKPFFFEFAGKKVGLYACAEHEFSIAARTAAGANPFDPLESLDHIIQTKAQCDYLIVLFHGGKEHYQYPSPGLQKVCRKMVDKGADLVVCQHTHCIGCEEKWNDGTIIYGQGNFFFDSCEGAYTDTGLLIFVDEQFRLSYLPIKKQEGTIRLASNEETTSILAEMEQRNREIPEPGFVEKEYAVLAKKMRGNYLSAFSVIGRNFFVRMLNKLTKGGMRQWLVKLLYHEKALLTIENYIVCETHRELLTEIVRETRKQN